MSTAETDLSTFETLLMTRGCGRLLLELASLVSCSGRSKLQCTGLRLRRLLALEIPNRSSEN